MLFLGRFFGFNSLLLDNFLLVVLFWFILFEMI